MTGQCSYLTLLNLDLNQKNQLEDEVVANISANISLEWAHMPVSVRRWEDMKAYKKAMTQTEETNDNKGKQVAGNNQDGM